MGKRSSKAAKYVPVRVFGLRDAAEALGVGKSAGRICKCGHPESRHHGTIRKECLAQDPKTAKYCTCYNFQEKE